MTGATTTAAGVVLPLSLLVGDGLLAPPPPPAWCVSRGCALRMSVATAAAGAVLPPHSTT